MRAESGVVTFYCIRPKAALPLCVVPDQWPWLIRPFGRRFSQIRHKNSVFLTRKCTCQPAKVVASAEEKVLLSSSKSSPFFSLHMYRPLGQSPLFFIFSLHSSLPLADSLSSSAASASLDLLLILLICLGTGLFSAASITVLLMLTPQSFSTRLLCFAFGSESCIPFMWCRIIPQ